MNYAREEVEAARRTVYAAMPPTPQYAWPQLRERLGMTVTVKHENHTPAGAFKVRGGQTYFEALARREPGLRGVISATRGNHGQSVGWGARRHGMEATIVVPHGNSVEKNAAMRTLGVTLVEHGTDFQEAREHAMALARARGLHMIPSYHRDLVLGVMTYWLEFFESFAKSGCHNIPRRCNCERANDFTLYRRGNVKRPSISMGWDSVSNQQAPIVAERGNLDV